MEIVCCSIASCMATLSSSLILSNSSIQTTPPSASTMAPPSMMKFLYNKYLNCNMTESKNSAVILLFVIHVSIILCLYVNMSVFWCFLMYACILFISVVCLSCVFLYYYEIIKIFKKKKKKAKIYQSDVFRQV